MRLLPRPTVLSRLVLAVGLAAFSGVTAVAQTALEEGDIAIIAVDPYNVDGINDQVSFVLLTAVEDETQIRFSDYDYDAGTDSFSDSGTDGELLVTLNALAAGTVVTINVGGSVVLEDGTQGSVTVSESGFGLSQFGGDSVVGFQGAGFTAGANAVAGRADDFLFFVNAGTSVTGAPSALGADAATSFANRTVVYDTRDAGTNAPTEGTKAELIAAFNDTSNYFVQNANINPGDYLPAAFTITDGAVSITITPSSSAGAPQAVAEDESRTFTVTLSRAPATSVTIPLASSATDEATVPASVTIAAGTMTQTFDVTGVQDATVDGDQAVTITTGAATGDADFAGTDPANVFVTVTDIDVDLGTELSPGDLAIIAVAPVNGGSSSVGGNDGEEFSFVLLTDVVDGTQINFSDYTTSANGTIAEGSFDGIVTVTLNALEAGTVVTANINTMALADPSHGSLMLVEGGFILSEFAGDAFFAYQGSATSPSADDFLYYTELPDA
ncbi:hypothetical protein, partial [Rubrivirga sp.]|uniref:hypothetical protein n=1 Tax=Rubrivirga sp. TaxID=1885344 RepID=UPI003C7104F7